ncbi:TetR/AcrR family transcriptional regulator [Vibrio sp. Of7-15]|uniref:TetR/AcrR family transcriptional regulator n=1 Tax=Vibrio sp. Of7-15 TaxID=2724879 RepID=UPI001EF33C77|nr:TetR/AcrR family transcriptional regulator [Vibrio sp. Of7-15]MCG7496831.1 TetR/AcrR family transcriptional regulator [Vibrio sp. Of7-15]
MKTRDRIIHAALELFNQEGERNVTTNHIAAHLDISPGNLYYHFRNKEEIIQCIFDLYAQDLATRFQPTGERDARPEVMIDYLDSIFMLMWNYRFFYANLPDILSRDEELQKKYLKAQQHLHENLITIMFNFRSSGLIELADDEIEAMTNTLKLVSSCWISYQTAMSPNTKVTESVIYQGVIQMLNVFRTIATKEGRSQILDLERHYQQNLTS